jgi:hypothetical protein
MQLSDLVTTRFQSLVKHPSEKANTYHTNQNHNHKKNNMLASITSPQPLDHVTMTVISPRKRAFLSSIFIAMVAAASSTAHAEEFVKNGNFDTNSDWTLETTVGISDGILKLDNNGIVDPKASQKLTGVKNGKKYILSAKYKIGQHARTFSKVGDHFFKISVGEKFEKEYVVPESDEWGELYYEFTADQDDAVLKIEGEIHGKDANVDIDNVSVVSVAETTYSIKAYPIKGAPGDNTKYYITPGEAGSRAKTVNDAPAARFIQVKTDEGIYAFKLISGDSESGVFLTANGPNEVNYVASANNIIPDGAMFRLVPSIFEGADGFSSLESVKFPKRYLRHFSFNLCVNDATPEEARNISENYQRDATWILEASKE